MKKNMGRLDRVMRFIVAIVVGLLYFTGQISGGTAMVLGTLAIVFLVTSFIGVCPLYMPLGMDTREEAADKPGTE